MCVCVQLTRGWRGLVRFVVAKLERGNLNWRAAFSTLSHEGWTFLRQVGPGYRRQEEEHEWAQEQKAAFLHVSASVPAWAPVQTALNERLWLGSVSQINPFSSNCLLAKVCTTVTEKPSITSIYFTKPTGIPGRWKKMYVLNRWIFRSCKHRNDLGSPVETDTCSNFSNGSGTIANHD